MLLKMKTVLATVYAVNPYKGSEDGMGWNLIYQIARYQKVIAITRQNNKQNIDQYMAEQYDVVYDNITFVYYDLPIWLRFWKRGAKGALFYYYLWQRFLPSFIKRQNLEFDVAHNLNFHNDWTPSFLWKLNKPFVWGPIGHHPFIPKAFQVHFDIKAKLKERFSWMIKSYFWKMSSNLQKTKEHAAHILIMNSTVESILNLRKDSLSVMPSVACEDNGYKIEHDEDKFRIITVGRLVHLKGFDIAILSFAKFVQSLSLEERKKCELVIVGDGPLNDKYKEIVHQLKIQDVVVFRNWMDRKSLMQFYNTSSLFLFPSHEGAGMVVAEALSFGLPVICFDNCGPGEFISQHCGTKVPYTNYEDSILQFSNVLHKYFLSPSLIKQQSLHARARYEKCFRWDLRGDQFRKIYLNLN